MCDHRDPASCTLFHGHLKGILIEPGTRISFNVKDEVCLWGQRSPRPHWSHSWEHNALLLAWLEDFINWKIETKQSIIIRPIYQTKWQNICCQTWRSKLAIHLSVHPSIHLSIFSAHFSNYPLHVFFQGGFIPQTQTTANCDWHWQREQHYLSFPKRFLTTCGILMNNMPHLWFAC